MYTNPLYSYIFHTTGSNFIFYAQDRHKTKMALMHANQNSKQVSANSPVNVNFTPMGTLLYDLFHALCTGITKLKICFRKVHFVVKISF